MTEFVIMGEKKGTGHVWKCKCCGRNFTGHKCKLTVHIAGKKFLNDRNMDVRSCTPAATIKQGDQYVPNTEQQALFKRARPLLLKYIQQHDEKTVQKQGLRSAVKVIHWQDSDSEKELESQPIHTMFGMRHHAEFSKLLIKLLC